MSIWDSIKVSNKASGTPVADGEFFTIHFSVENARIRCAPDMTLQRALSENAARLGYDNSRAVTWRDDAGVVPPSTVGKANASYVASVSLETKGL